MVIFSVDTSHRAGSVCLARADGEAVEVLASGSIAGGTFSAELIPRLADLLEQAKLSKSDIGAYACAIGPGSFTGLRIGLTAIKALAEVMPKPIAAVSTLAAVALGAGAGKLLAATDAGRGEYYVAEFPDGEALAPAREFVAAPDAIRALVAESGARLVTPEQKLMELLSGSQVVLVANSSAESVAKLGARMLSAGKQISADKLDAHYVRSDVYTPPAAAGR